MRSVVFGLLLLAGCAAPPPYTCSTPIEMSGRGLALCRDPMQTPVCDAPGDMARYEMATMAGYVLHGGTIASCDSSNQVVCADRTVLPHCIVHPLDP
jgi:hypothetical protein